MRTSIVIDDQLMNDAIQLTGAKTRKDAVELGLRTLIKLKKQERVVPHLTVVGLEFVIKMINLRTFCNLSCMSSYESKNCFLSQ